MKISAAFAFVLAAGGLQAAADGGWPQFRGPNRDGLSAETGLIRAWPEAGPKQLWRAPIGVGYSGMIVAGGKLYTMDGRDGKEYVACIDAGSGKTLWRTEVGALFTNNFGDGPRSTPTLDGDTLYALGSNGRLVSLAAGDGAVNWQVEFREQFASKLPTWAFCAAPLVLGDAVILEAGGTEGRAIVAFDKSNGQVRWSAVDDEIAYSSPIVVDFHGVRQLVFLTKSHIVALTPAGRRLWTSEFVPRLNITPAAPVFVKPDMIFVSASYDAGAKTVRMKPDGGSVTVETLWEGRQMRNHFNASVALDGKLYGFDKATLKCLDAATGKELWAKRGLGKGSLIVADGMLILLGERGKLVLAEAVPDAYRELAAHQALTGRCWTQPTLAGGKLYLRNDKEMACYQLGAPSS